MSFINQTQTNTTAEFQRQGLLGIVLLTTITTLICCVFLFVNGTMLFTLRSKPVFRETSRFILLSNLLFADTVQLADSQTLFLMSALGVKVLYPVCAALTVLYILPHGVSFLTLVLMCLERYIAVCYPLRHAAIITIRNTGAAICVLWTFSSLNCLIQLSLMLNVSFEDMQQMQMKDYCGKESVFHNPVSNLYDKTSTYSLFTLAGVTVTFSYFGIIVAARSASTDKASAKKALKTLLMHLLQLGLSMSSTVHSTLIIVVSTNLDRVIAVNIQVLLYLCLNIIPKCLSSLIYGLRDQTIRPVLMFYLSCRCQVHHLSFYLCSLIHQQFGNAGDREVNFIQMLDVVFGNNQLGTPPFSSSLVHYNCFSSPI
ncbi:odorant receptor 131-2-like [Leuresthes tenuis]|uniref:odorant receptor 131-2-like n=1 Tax=Leuresthes tenuis TaxID=355514 RepID=UPI003B50D240